MAKNNVERSLRIGSPIINGISGSLLFIDANGRVQQDNANLFWDNTNDRLGIGTTSPGAKLTITGGNISLTTANSIITGNTGLTLQETGDLYGTVKLHLQNRTGVNGAMFEQAGSVDLVDFVFKSLSNQRNIRFENRAAYVFVENPEFQIGVADNPTLVIGDSVSAFRIGNVGIGTTTPSNYLHVLSTTNQKGITVESATDNTQMDLKNTGTNGTSWNLVSTSGTSGWGGSTGNFAIVQADASARLVINNIGNVGIGTTSPSSKLEIAGAIETAFTSATAAYTVTGSDSIIACDATTAAFAVTLPTAAGIGGRQYTIKKIDSSVNAITVDPTGTETVDGAATYSLAAQWQYVIIVSDGTNWLITANN